MNEMMNSNTLTTAEQFPIFELPGRLPFMLARDVATAYGVPVKELSQARERNSKKFIEDVDCFQLTETEVTNCDLEWRGGHLPFGYTKKAAHMFATILSTDEAIAMAIRIVEGFLAFENIGKHLLPPGSFAVPFAEYAELQKVRADHLQHLLDIEGATNRYTPWPEKNIQFVFAKKQQGVSHREIGKRLKRSKDSVDHIVKKHQHRFSVETEQADLFSAGTEG